MKILFLSHNFYPVIGGIEVHSEILALKFNEMGHQVRLLTWTNEVGERKFPFDIVRNPSLRDLLNAHRWATIVYENNPCLRMSWPNLFIKRPLIVALHTWISRINGEIAWQDRLKTQWLKRAASVIAVSEAIRKKNFLKATVIGNPYSENAFKIIPGIHRSFDLVFLGRLVSDKGANLAIEALAALCFEEDEREKKTWDLSLTIIGDGPEKALLENLAKNRKVADRVVFKGKLQGIELVKCLNQHKVILVPSIWEEPFGNVALEGMACGCIPIVSDGGGLPDAVGHAGIIFERGNVKALTKCIKTLLADPELEKQFRSNAKNHLLHHRSDRISEKYERVLNDASKNRRAKSLTV